MNKQQEQKLNFCFVMAILVILITLFSKVQLFDIRRSAAQEIQLMQFLESCKKYDEYRSVAECVNYFEKIKD